MAKTKISADDHIDLGYLPRDLWTARLPKSLLERAPHVEDRGEKGEYWVCDGETWADYRGERWFARTNRTRLALDRGGVEEAFMRQLLATAYRLGRAHGTLGPARAC